MNPTTGIAVRRELVVHAPRDRAFATFVDMTAWWPLETHALGATPARSSTIEPRAGGRWYEIDANGEQHTIGEVVAYEPPDRLLLTWDVSCGFTYDPSFRTEVEVTFADEAPGHTRVVLEHRGLEAHGERAEESRALYEGDGAWTAVLARFAAAFG